MLSRKEFLTIIEKIFTYETYNNIYSIQPNYINYQTLRNIEQSVRELYIRISVDSVNLIFSVITVLLVIIRILSDHNHENESNSLYNIL